jgi:asparagine synthase (glutamine-hydrolysing)
VWQYGEPFADESAIPSLYLAQAARQHVTVALNGDGGDESFAGYGHYVSGTIASRLGVVPRPLAHALGSLASLAGGDPPRFSAARRARWLAHAMTLQPAEMSTLMAARFTEAQRSALYTDEYKAELARCTPLSAAGIIPAALADSDAPTALERFLDADVSTYLPSDLLVKMDIATMTHSLEVRSPLLDHVFMELAAGLPASLKMRGRRRKVGLKDALRPWVPDHVLDRPKMGFSVPLADWFRGELRDYVRDLLTAASARSRAYVDPAYVRQLVDEHARARHDHGHKLWALLTFEVWLRQAGTTA